MVVPHLKVGNISWTCVEGNIVWEMEECKSIGLRGFDYKLFEEEGGGGVQEGIYGYPYLKHLIELCPGGWEDHLSKINEVVDKNNQHQKEAGKIWSVKFFLMSSEHVLSALFWKLPMGRKDAGFGEQLAEMTLGRRQSN